MNAIIFRWSIWGNDSQNLDMLFYSISSFRRFFGSGHEYIVYTDNPQNVSDNVKKLADVRLFPKNCLFNFKSKPTWQKWCAGPRLDSDKTEFFIDSDVFLVNQPKEIEKFLSDDKYKFAILDEFKGESWQHGVMTRRATKDTPFVNAGLFIQKHGSDITADFLDELNWWKENIKIEDQTHYDEQGALAVALTKYLMKGELLVLPKDKYTLINRDLNTGIDDLNTLTLFHAMGKERYAYHKFLPELKRQLTSSGK